MIKNFPPSSEQIKELIGDKKFDYFFPDSPNKGYNNRRDSGREGEDYYVPANKKSNVKLTAEDANIAALVMAMQQQMRVAISKNPALAEHVDTGILNIDPSSLKGQSLKSLLTAVCAMQSEVKSEAAEENGEKSLLASFVDKCKTMLFGKKCCHEANKAVLAAPVNPEVGKIMANVASNMASAVAEQELGKLTPLLKNIANIDPGFVVNLNNPRKQPQTVVV